jgi:hypothetical protein
MKEKGYIIILNDASKDLKDQISKTLRPICQIGNTVNAFTISEL